jgi:hypothetical protein
MHGLPVTRRFDLATLITMRPNDPAWRTPGDENSVAESSTPPLPGATDADSPYALDGKSGAASSHEGGSGEELARSTAPRLAPDASVMSLPIYGDLAAEGDPDRPALMDSGGEAVPPAAAPAPLPESGGGSGGGGFESIPTQPAPSGQAGGR